MRSLTTRWTLLAFVLMMLVVGGSTQADGPTATKSSGPFADVPDGHWATDYLKYLADRGIIEGLPNGTFQGERAPSRYEVAAMLARTLRFVEEAETVPASDGSAIRPEDLKVLQDLIFKISDRLQQLSGEVDAIKSARPEIDPQLAERIKGLESQTEVLGQLRAQLETQQRKLAEVESQVKQFQVRATTASEEKLSQADQQILANRIIGITGLIFAVVGIALTTLR